MNTNEEFVFYTNNVTEFSFITKSIGDVETGILLDSEIKIDDKTSVITEKEIPFSSPAETRKNYLKVMEMRDLTPEEATLADKARAFLRRVYKGIFRGRMFTLVYTLTMATCLILHLNTANYFGIFTSIASALIVLGPKRLITEIVKLATINDRREQLNEYLREENLLSVCNSVYDDEDIKLYIKQR